MTTDIQKAAEEAYEQKRQYDLDRLSEMAPALVTPEIRSGDDGLTQCGCTDRDCQDCKRCSRCCSCGEQDRSDYD